jgi:hypothetical protein
MMVRHQSLNQATRGDRHWALGAGAAIDFRQHIGREGDDLSNP